MSDRLAYFRVWISQGFRYPGIYLSATVNNTYEYFAFNSDAQVVYPDQFHDMTDENRYDFWLARAKPGVERQQIQDLAVQFSGDSVFASIRQASNDWYEQVRSLPVIDLLTSRAVYASWIPMFALALAWRRRSVVLMAATLPALLTLGTFVAGPISLPRYLVPAIGGSVLLVGLLFCRTVLGEREAAVGLPAVTHPEASTERLTGRAASPKPAEILE